MHPILLQRLEFRHLRRARPSRHAALVRLRRLQVAEGGLELAAGRLVRVLPDLPGLVGRGLRAQLHGDSEPVVHAAAVRVHVAVGGRGLHVPRPVQGLRGQHHLHLLAELQPGADLPRHLHLLLEELPGPLAAAPLLDRPREQVGPGEVLAAVHRDVHAVDGAPAAAPGDALDFDSLAAAIAAEGQCVSCAGVGDQGLDRHLLDWGVHGQLRLVLLKLHDLAHGDVRRVHGVLLPI
mmetsp:Transcript_86985/g.246612  ORF Transcript_86985/g.246612 Transcript_86985/m.246612 type:complete len:236 (-) Transcript_86985:1349-2056(-)